MIKIRLKRMGSKRKPFYRIVVADSRRQRDGKYIELVGTYNPKLGEVKVRKEVALKWLSNGANPTPTVKNIFSHEGIIAEFHNLKNKAKLEVKSKSGSRFGKEVDLLKNYIAPGTKMNSTKKEEKEAAVEELEKAKSDDGTKLEDKNSKEVKTANDQKENVKKVEEKTDDNKKEEINKSEKQEK